MNYIFKDELFLSKDEVSNFRFEKKILQNGSVERFITIMENNLYKVTIGIRKTER